MADFWDRVQAMRGRVLKTRSRGKEFEIVEVRSDGLVLLPREGKGIFRPIKRSSLEEIANLGLDESALTPSRLRQTFPDNQNLSYIAAIVNAAWAKA